MCSECSEGPSILVSVPSGPAPSKGGSGLGMAGKGLFGMIQPELPLESEEPL